ITALTCQDLSFVGGQLYNCPYPAPTSADSVDVSTVTVASFWAAGPPDDTACQHEPTQRGKSFSAANDWNELQKSLKLETHISLTNFKEGELARLHEENNKLKEFLNSSFVKTLEEKTKLLLGSQVKRTCRNLSLQFCSEEELASTPPVDLWILQTLGLKDEDTIDTTSTEYSFNSSIDSLTKCSTITDSSGDYCQTTDHKSTAYDTPTDAIQAHLSLLSQPVSGHPVGGDVTTQYPELSTPRGRTELAFSMSLNPSSSVRLKTHSFPQGQAFVRKDTLGGWNFTWVPKQGP
uniref:Geminin coiled-coil domain containing n=1 Tax=Oncorhynchus mykiss TaxID=8022 RepID=A0A8K9X049_ONCMY